MIDLNYNENIKELYLPGVSARSRHFYLLLLTGILLIIASLPFIKVDVAVRSQGVVRPLRERTEIHAQVSAFIEEVFYKEGDIVEKGALLFKLRNDNAFLQNSVQLAEIKQRRENIHDLELLCSQSYSIRTSQLSSPVFQRQYDLYTSQTSALKAQLRKAQRVYNDNVKLKADKVISEYEFMNSIVEYNQLKASYQAKINEQNSIWAQELIRNRLELANYESQQGQLSNDAKMYEVRAPVKGAVMNLNSKYIGNSVLAGELLCSVSPEDSLIAECFVSTRDVGLIQLGHNVRFQIDAFDYNFFGVVTGTVDAIDNDFTIQDSKPFFKVRCRFDPKQLLLKNGYVGTLKKGLTFQARFIIAQRTLWQLIFDRIDDWLNPIAPIKK